MAKLKSIEPLYAGFILLRDDKRPKAVPVCSGGCWDLMGYLNGASKPLIRKLLERSLNNDITIGSKYLIKLALDNTVVGEYPHETIGDVFDAMTTSKKRHSL